MPVARGLTNPGSWGVAEQPGEITCDVAIIGSGMGGATLAWALRESSARVLVLEAGGYLPREPENWSPYAVHRQHRYRNSEAWIDAGTGRAFIPGNYHYVGGNTKFFGAAMLRLREADFQDLALEDGVSPAWPIAYGDLEPFYGDAERLYNVHGGDGDPTGPPRSEPYPWPPVPDDPPIAELRSRLLEQGLKPFPLPLAVDWRHGGRCVRCGTCDSYPCMLDAKGDADVCALRPALESGNVRLLTNSTVIAVQTAGDRVTQLQVRRGSETRTVVAERYVLAAGAVNSAALLLRSAPHGVANGSGEVGRNYMAHVSSFVAAWRPQRDPHLLFEKTIALNDWYLGGSGLGHPLGNIQGLGKLYGDTIKPARPYVPTAILDWIARRSVELYVETEDLPLPRNRIELDGAGRIVITWRPTNVKAHRRLLREATKALRRAGYPIAFRQTLGIEATAHQCGTLRMGADPATSVVDPLCRSHDLENLWVVDASVFPSSAAVNPGLTVAANALRIAAAGHLTS